MRTRLGTRSSALAVVAAVDVLVSPLGAQPAGAAAPTGSTPVPADPTQATDADESDLVEGRVLGIDAADIIIDLAQKKGVRDGQLVELWRPITLKHPVTGEAVSDRFRIGRLRITQARSSLSLARADGRLARAAQPGDVVVLRLPHKPSQPGPVAPAPEATAPALTAPAPSLEPPPAALTATVAAPADPEAAEVSALFERLRGASLASRIFAYEGYAEHRPRSRFAVVLAEEARHLRRLAVLASHANDEAPTRPKLVNFDGPFEAPAGVPVSIGVELAGASGAVLHWRDPGEVAFTSTPMDPAGEGYFTVTLPGARMKAPGIEYFVEGATAAGNAVPVLASPRDAKRLVLRDVPEPKTVPHHPARVCLNTDYANWNYSRHNDYVWQTEGQLGMRFADLGVRAARSGFGVYRGVGGSLDELDDHGLSGRAVGLTYGYLEGEFGVSHFSGLIGRLLIGLEDDGVVGGVQAFVRLGNDEETNLMLGGEVLGTIGLRGITQLELDVFERFPILLRTEVTNQPAGSSAEGILRPGREGASQEEISSAQGDVGARVIAQLGYRVVPELVVAGRVSYQGRTINHAGPGVGGGVTCQW
jgi:hypothetical protein